MVKLTQQLHRRTKVVFKPPQPETHKQLEEHVSPGGKTTYTTKPGASDAAKRKALSKARNNHGNVAPRVANKRARDEFPEDIKAVSPGGRTVYMRPSTPSPLKKGNPHDLEPALFKHERQLHQMRQSKRLLDARARTLAAAASIVDQRLSLGLKLLRDAVTGNLPGLSDIQLRGTIVNALVCLRAPDEKERHEGKKGNAWEYAALLSPRGDGQRHFVEPFVLDHNPTERERFDWDRERNSSLLNKAGCCQLVTAALKLFPDDTGIANAGFALAEFLLDWSPKEERADTVLIMYHQELSTLAPEALLRPLSGWSSVDFKAAGNIFWAVGAPELPIMHWLPDNEDIEVVLNMAKPIAQEHFDYLRENPDVTDVQFGEKFMLDLLRLNDEQDEFVLFPNQPCRSGFCHDGIRSPECPDMPWLLPVNTNAQLDRAVFYKVSIPEYRSAIYNAASFVVGLIAYGGGACILEARLPADFAAQWSRRLRALFEEVLEDNLPGYPVCCNYTMDTLTHLLEITETFAGTAKWLPLLRASGCFAVLSYITNTVIPFLDIQAVLKRGEMQARAKDLIRCFASSGSEV